MEEFNFILLLAAFGFSAGFLAALSSTGPSLLLIPFLTALYQSVGYSGDLTTKLVLIHALATMTAVFMASTFTHYRLGHFGEYAVLLLLAGALVGACAGVRLQPSLNPRIVLIFVAIGIIFVGFAVVQRPDRYESFATRHVTPKRLERGLAGPIELILIGALSGLLSASTGVGCGLVAIPLQFLLGMPVLSAIHNASLVSAFSSITALGGYLLVDKEVITVFSAMGFGELLQLLTLVSAGAIGAKLGVSAGNSGYRKVLRPLIGPLYIIVGMILLWQQTI